MGFLDVSGILQQITMNPMKIRCKPCFAILVLECKASSDIRHGFTSLPCPAAYLRQQAVVEGQARLRARGSERLDSVFKLGQTLGGTLFDTPGPSRESFGHRQVIAEFVFAAH